MPIFINILRGPCIFQSNSPEQASPIPEPGALTYDQLWLTFVRQKLRHCILEVLHRLPTAPAPVEPFEPFAEEICDLLMQLVRTDNEDNATLCVKVTSDIMRHQHKVLQGKVQQFLSLIQELFEQMERSCGSSSTMRLRPPALSPGLLQHPAAPRRTSSRRGQARLWHLSQSWGPIPNSRTGLF